MKIAEWNSLCAAAEAAGFYQFTMSAEENAQFTIYVEKAAPESEFADMCLGSLEALLCDSDDTAAAAFFKSQGVRW